MNIGKIKIATLFLLILILVQCQAKPQANSNSENGNYKELTELIKNSEKLSGGVSFVAAAAISTPCVVHIKTKANVTVNYYNPFSGFFGNDIFNQPRTQKQESSGSGVIVSPDGYIVTNFHVIQNATEIEVTLRNKNIYKAKVIGQDKESDIALIKIEETDLASINMANSDEVMVGEWVLAVGNPFNLESTVTQGIVSAKGRSLNMGNQSEGGEQQLGSFIQTDAAVNPGNSGGALVNLKGELIGINTAIASPTGAYAGYAFAVPSNVVKKVIDDLKKYGNVQKAQLGIEALQLTSQKAKELKLSSPNGVLIGRVVKGSAADDAGIKPNDVLTKINNNDISSFTDLLEHISSYSPGEKIDISYIRNGSLASTQATLKNRNNTTEIIKADNNYIGKLGIKLQPISAVEAEKFRIQGGLRVAKINGGIIANGTEMKEGFIILSINDIPVKSESEVNEILSRKTNQTVVVEGFYPNRPYTFQYAFRF